MRFRSKSASEISTGPHPESQQESPLLPFDIRYNLKYRNGLVTGAEALSLVRALPHLGLYAAAKISDHVAHKVLPGLFSEFLFGTNRTQALSDVLTEHADDSAKLSKLSQINVRMDVWTQMFEKVAWSVEPDQSPFLYAYSTVSGIEAFANSYGLPFGVVIPPSSETESWRGIMINVPDRVVSEVFPIETLPKRSLIIDDTLVTGKHRQHLMQSIGSPDTEFTVLIDRSNNRQRVFDEQPVG